MIRFRVLGSLELRDDNEQRKLRSVLAQPKRLALLAYLAVARPAGFHRRDTLLPLFWPELDEAHARNALNQALSFLRQELGADVVMSRGPNEVGVDPSQLWCDAASFCDALNSQRNADALEVYRGDLLVGFLVGDAPEFERWVSAERVWQRQKASEAARDLAERSAEAGNLTAAIDWGRQAANLAVDDERAFRRLLMLLAKAGDRAGAIQAYEAFVRRLRSEYDVEPAAETRALADAIRLESVGKPVAATAHIAEVGGTNRVVAPPVKPEEARYTLPLGPGHTLSDGRYVIERAIGMGGMATVYLARDVRHERNAAVKILRPDVAVTTESERLIREIRIAAGLQHPHIVPVFDSGESAGRVYYVMPHVVGESLRSRLQRSPRLSMRDAIRTAREVADALAYAHRRGIVHRDIKPENVLLTSDPDSGEFHALVADFGLAKAIDESRVSEPSGDAVSLTKTGIGFGTPGYISPEQATGGEVDRRADLYAWGVMTYELLAGEHPFTDRTTPQQLIAAQISARPEPLDVRWTGAPASLAALVMRCLEKDPAARPGGGDELLAELDRATVVAPNDAWPGPWVLQHVVRSSKRVWALAGVMLVAIGAVAGWKLLGRAASDPLVVAVAPFGVNSADTSLFYLREGMIELLAIRLNTIGGLRGSDPGTLMFNWERAAGSRGGKLPQERALSVAGEVGAGNLVLGHLVGDSASLTLTANLLEVPTGRVVATAKSEGRRDSLAALVDKLAAQLVSLRAGQGTERLEALTTASPEALRQYLDGQATLRRGRPDSAMRQFLRAVELDSTFGIAAVALLNRVRSGDGTMAVRLRADSLATRVAWRERNRLPLKERLLFDIRLGPQWPIPGTVKDWLVSAERLVALAPDDPDAHFELGDALYHTGTLLGIPDALPRAGRAFRRFAELEPAHRVGHKMEVCTLMADTTCIRGMSKAGASLGNTVTQLSFAYHVALVLNDTLAQSRIRAKFPSVNEGRPARVPFRFYFDQGLSGREAQIVVDDAFARVVTTAQRSSANLMAAAVAQARGQPRLAAEHYRLVTSFSEHPHDFIYAPTVPALLALNAALLEGDTAAGTEAAREVDSVLALPAPPNDVEQTTRLLLSFASAEYHFARGNRGPAVQAIRRMRNFVPPVDSSWLRRYFDRTAALLEAQLAVADGRRDAPRFVRKLDELLLDPDYVDRFAQFANIISAQLWRRLGRHEPALAAIRRREYDQSINPYAAIYFREQGRLAARVGNREEAIRAYRQYLALRDAPEPSVAPEVERVRAELAQLDPDKVKGRFARLIDFLRGVFNRLLTR